MPNWCECDLYIKGKDVAKVLASIEGVVASQDGAADGKPEKTAFDFEKVFPIPAPLRIPSSSLNDLGVAVARNDISRFLEYAFAKEQNIQTAEELCKYYGKTVEEMAALGQRILSNIQQFDAPTWYEWCNANWGTKWNACDAVVARRSKSSAKIQFRTAWAAPERVIKGLAMLFPEHTFTLRYFEGGMGFQGFITVRGEKVLDWAEKNYRGSRGG